MLQIKTNRFSLVIVIGLGGERKVVRDNENRKTTSTSSQRRYSATPIKPRGSPSCLTLLCYGVSTNDVSAMIVTRGNLVSRSATTICVLVMLLCLASRTSGEYGNTNFFFFPPDNQNTQLSKFRSRFINRAFAESREMGSNGGSSDSISPSNDFGSCIDGKCVKRQDIASGMWFGPRLGRRRRSDEKQEVSPDIEVLANALDGVRWAVITIPGKKLKSFRAIHCPGFIKFRSCTLFRKR